MNKLKELTLEFYTNIINYYYDHTQESVIGLLILCIVFCILKWIKWKTRYNELFLGHFIGNDKDLVRKDEVKYLRSRNEMFLEKLLKDK